MAGDGRWPLRQGILSKLLAQASLTALVSTRIYDEVVETPVFPFVVIDTQDSSEAGDKTNNVQEVVTSIYAWSTYRGYKEVEQILAAVYDALHNSAPTVSGYTVMVSMFDNSKEGRDADGITRWGYTQFRFTLDPA